MTTGVSHTFGGNVVVADIEDDASRFDLSPEQAEKAADDLSAAAAKPLGYCTVIIEALSGRRFQFDGIAADATKMAADLREHAGLARLKARIA